jgi:putative nucleotidyltransferase with HDIG domain
MTTHLSPASDQPIPIRERLTREVEMLPVLPHVVTRILDIDTASETAFDELVQLLESEPNYAVRLVAAANSVATRGVSTITRIRDAVVRLGVREVSNLLMSMAVVRVFVPRSDWERGLWTHAIEVGSVARALARHSNLGLDHERAYLTGLLHDVGRFILFNLAPASLREVDEAEWHSPAELVAAERSICGMDHAELGALVCARWSVPTHFVDFVRVHHAPDVEARLPGEAGRIARLVQVADLAGFSAVSRRHGLTSFLDLSPADAERLIRSAIPSWFHRTTGLVQTVGAALEAADSLAHHLGLRPKR